MTPRRLAILALCLACSVSAGAVTASAALAPSVNGAIYAVIRAVAEEGGNVVYYEEPQVHCRRIAPKRFGCSFLNLIRSLPGRTTVTWAHGHYFVGEARYERREREREYVPLCGTAYVC